MDETPNAEEPPEVVLQQNAQVIQEMMQRVLSKHDEKWNHMFQKLVAYKEAHNSTLVPQCYDSEPRLGRWVHYQRVEYWIAQQNGKYPVE